MPRVYLNKNLVTTPSGQLPGVMQDLLNQLEDQINAGPSIASLSSDKDALPQGMQNGDLVFNSNGGELKVGLFNGSSVDYASFGSFTGAITDDQHGTRSGGNLHPAATASVAGFMSAVDKAKFDQFKGFIVFAGPVSSTQLPNAGDWCFFTDSTGPTFMLAANFAGAIKTTLMT